MLARCSAKLLPAAVMTAALLAVWTACAHRVRASEPRSFGIRNARIVPVAGPPIDNGAIVISNGLIAAVGANVAIPPEAEVIDGSGMTVYPGLIDAGTDVGLAATTTTAAAGRGAGGGAGRGTATGAPLSMGPQDRPATMPWVSAADEIHSDDRRIESWRDAGFTTALVLPQSGIFPGQGALADLSAAPRASALVVKNDVALPVNFAGGRGLYQGFPGALMGELSYVHQVFLDAQWYAAAEKLYETQPAGLERPEYDRTDVLIAQVIASKELVLVPGNTDVDILRVLKLAPQWGVRWALWGAQQGYNLAPEIAAAHVPVVVDVNWPRRDANLDAEAAQHEPLRTLRFRDRAPATPAALAKAGVKMAFSSGAAASASDILRNINRSIAAGLAPDAALRALTTDAAEIFGVGDRLGSIAPGKIANLVVANGALFQEGTQMKWVFVDGQPFEVRTPPPAPAGGRGQGAPGAATGSGRWHIVTDTGGQTEEADLDLEVAADGSVGGSISSHFGTATIRRGMLNGDALNFTFQMDVGTGGPVDIEVQATIQGQRMTGTIGMTGQMFPFTGTRPRGNSSQGVEP